MSLATFWGHSCHRDTVCIWHHRANVKPMLKRLTFAVPDIEPLHPDSAVMPVIICEQTSPPKRYAIPMDKVRAAHKVIAAFSLSAKAGWQDYGLYACDCGDRDRFIDSIKVRTKKGAV